VIIGASSRDHAQDSRKNLATARNELTANNEFIVSEENTRVVIEDQMWGGKESVEN
jgi:hypothetical protein